MKPLNNKIIAWNSRRIWIIGASSGIGAALVSALHNQGAQLALSARRTEKLNNLASTGDLVLPMDVTNNETIQKAFYEITNEWNELDLLIYCAGYYQPMRAWEMDLPVIEQTLDTNLDGVFKVLDPVIPHLVEQGKGGICMVASVAGFTGLPKALVYGPSKAALINLTQILYSDLNPKGIDVYMVNPGFVQTRLTKKNDFPMPALMDTEQAAKSILKGMEKGEFHIHFPKRFTSFMRLFTLLPDRLRFYLLKRAVTP